AEIVVQIFEAGEPIGVKQSCLDAETGDPAELPGRGRRQLNLANGCWDIERVEGGSCQARVLDETGPCQSAGAIEQDARRGEIAEPGPAGPEQVERSGICSGPSVGNTKQTDDRR